MKRKLTRERVYALRGWIVKVVRQGKEDKFYVSSTATPNQGRHWAGPYKSLQHATTAIARKMQREFARRDQRHRLHNGGAHVGG